MKESKDTLAYRFAEFASGLNYARLPKEVIDAMKLYIMDWFGCAVGGLREPSSLMLLNLARELNGRSDSTVLGVGDKMEPTLAAFVNSNMSHSLEMDDDHRTMTGHPGVPVIPAALAVSEKRGLSGKQFIEAAVAGYEMIIRAGTCFLGRAYYGGWHPTSTTGVFGATAAAAKALGLDTEQMATALGIAGATPGGTREFEFNWTLMKRFHPGNAARNGVFVAMLAKHGFTGPWSVFEGPFGFFNLYSEHRAEIGSDGKPILRPIYDPSLLCDKLGERFDLLTNSFKVHCGGRFGATAIDAALEIVNKHDINADQVKEISIGASDFTNRAHFIEGCRRPSSVVAAQFSLPFAMALVLLKRKVSINDFTDEMFRDPKAMAIMDSVTNYVDEDAQAAYPKHYVAKVTIKLKDGRELAARVDYPKGDPENRPTLEELQNKFRDLAGITLPKEKVERLLDALMEIEKIENIGSLTAMAVK
jgi:2-methylcitrate dehydratase PrpD